MAKIIIGTIYRKEKFILHCEEVCTYCMLKGSLSFGFFLCCRLEIDFSINPTLTNLPTCDVPVP